MLLDDKVAVICGGGGAIGGAIARETLLGRAATLADVGSVAAFLVSDQAATITATEINFSAGALVD